METKQLQPEKADRGNRSRQKVPFSVPFTRWDKSFSKLSEYETNQLRSYCSVYAAIPFKRFPFAEIVLYLLTTP